MCRPHNDLSISESGDHIDISTIVFKCFVLIFSINWTCLLIIVVFISSVFIPITFKFLLSILFIFYP